MTVQAQELIPHQAGPWLVPAVEEIDQEAVVYVPVGALSATGSPRMSGENPEHVQALAAAHTELPPIIVHRATMRVIDGVHRLRVAQLRGQDEIATRFFYGDEADAFVLAVKSNVAHGLPLSVTDRKAAASRIIDTHPQWSDRMIASVTGVASRTVAELRKRPDQQSAQAHIRIGHDGRVRPINSSPGRLLASEVIANNPDLSLRQIARAAGISPETARDVRNRLRRGEDPVPKPRAKNPGNGNQAGKRRSGHGAGVGLARASSERPAEIIERLRADPALRFTETGRTLLRLLHLHLIENEEWEKIGQNVPPHCSGIIVRLARECAQMWREFAEQVERKVAGIP